MALNKEKCEYMRRASAGTTSTRCRQVLMMGYNPIHDHEGIRPVQPRTMDEAKGQS